MGAQNSVMSVQYLAPSYTSDDAAATKLNSAIAKEIVESDQGEGYSFYACDLDVVVEKINRWKALFPRVEPFYAIKANPDKAVLEKLIEIGIGGFDCCRQSDLAYLLEIGVDPTKIIYDNPCKLPAAGIRFARKSGIRKMTVDSLDEIERVAKHHPEAELILRVESEDAYSSAYHTDPKFGAPMSSVEAILTAAKGFKLNVVGLCFHIGCGSKDAKQYYSALKSIRSVYDKAVELGYDRDALNLLSIGGGFPSMEKEITLDQIAKAVNKGLEDYFPLPQFSNLRIISEPGRYVVANAFVLATNICFKRESVDRETGSKKFAYYLPDGIYGSFLGACFDEGSHVQVEAFTQGGRFFQRTDLAKEIGLFNTTAWGPTCSADMLFRHFKLPELEVGDWLVFRSMGAYRVNWAAYFSNVATTKIIYVNK